MSVTGTASTTTSGLGPEYTGGTAAAKTDESAQDRFLKMLVAQMQNQDPLNPMDNAEVTSQMAQINTVTGIEKLNAGISTMITQLLQAQTMQGAALVGRDVLVPGNSIYMIEGRGNGAFELSGKADKVTVEVLDASGKVLDTVELGALEGGRHHFQWQAEDVDQVPAVVSYRITATSGGNGVPVSTYTRDTVGAVSANGSKLELDLYGGSTVSYDQVKAVV
ncbi:flagellar hook assembly protein FlgD [Caldimonas thermodepolymerans]|jgi:flagellar basal-body rod modification protein FlgD|uniref:Basal-body rod modification protein FlgD n=1 Tax=Caldimonas thermodepolymerans TaxID=215580 RepID=A0A2S5T9Q4_9BURK|nr:flagellar hook capping FlgD N-terminal domain-containing protein [Caldimonas thermodepolymerans]PPE71735.1 flagellar biosynthesis protein FlgD [Caldimonas thermodepolymerans]QPC30761.1 flagellar hook assembly protein FlgD [Caldimonas thermodepolymerans]RDI02619.1 flagellar basal-body rod modification protein FlgD [Caldimonas thermodepolymerans]